MKLTPSSKTYSRITVAMVLLLIHMMIMIFLTLGEVNTYSLSMSLEVRVLDAGPQAPLPLCFLPASLAFRGTA